ncbi:hypothetical protein N7520_004935 [Penicillium odoratum]|uniref:uncharacterized protein n=1 Tax=Penicillium odoratum TaxID=1167516 RepID=UPI0025467CF1|nr:uncharacterized protein N7520_004935 [Penicillium odoratum]KAJ5765376.1 hypothetical protein N7520_004935 [Penicillium odoratum]
MIRKASYIVLPLVARFIYKEIYIDIAENYATSTPVDVPQIIQSAIPITTNQANGKGPLTAFPILRNFDLIKNDDFHDKLPAWADARQSLCDSLPWYRAVQGSCYNHGGICYGFLIDEDCGSGFYMDEEIIITRVGGSYSKVDGGLRLNKDQSLTRYPAMALQRSMVDKFPVGMIIGNKNSLLGPILEHRYTVLAYFRITNIWFEKIDTYAGLKIRFEKLDLLEKSWWAAKDSPNPLPYEARNPLTVAKPEVIKCLHCLQPSPRAFERGWMCLTHDCARFWKIGNINQPENLTYHSAWLSTRQNPRDDENTQNPMQEPSGPLIPDHAQVLRESNELDTTHRLSWRGLVCPWCRKCMSRTLWEGWKCNSDPKLEDLPDTCKFEMMIQLMQVPASLVLRQHEPVPEIPSPGLNVDLVSCLPYHKYTYDFPGVGSLTQFRANQSIQEVPGGPNDLFENLQKEPLGLKRYPLQSSVVTGILTSHFAVNYGMPYKYVVSVASKGFSEAPDAILRSLGRLTWATEKAVTAAGGVFQPPNELLTLGYFEGMKIGYHDDGENGLGPTIATLSLGASSTMSLRMKPKYYHGRSKSGVLPKDDIVLPGCRLEKRRLTLKKQFKKGTIDRDTYDRRRATAFQHENLTGEAPVSVVMNLHHGDLVVMHGENLQKYYEHSVISNDLLRFALTARYIKPDSVNRSEIAKGDFTLTPDQAYNGN